MKRREGTQRNEPQASPNERTNEELLALLENEPTVANYETIQTPRLKSELNRPSFFTKLSYYVPVISWLPNYTLELLGGDAVAALSMASLLIPQSISYATSLSFLPPASGLISAAVPSVIYSLLGTCRQLSVGPEAALSLLIGQTIQRILIEEEAHAGMDLTQAMKLKISLSISAVITFEAGLITLALGLCRLGFIDAVLSRALLRGFISAIALVILVSQLIPMLGLSSLVSPEGTIEKIFWILENLESAHWNSAIISFISVLILVSAKVYKAKLSRRKGFRFLSYIPEVLFVVIGSTFLTWYFQLDKSGLAILGAISPGLVRLKLPFFHGSNYLRSCLTTSAVIAILGFLDSIVAAKDLSKAFDYPISANRELVALGFSNTIVSFVGGALPAYGSITRSRLAGATGARSQMCALLTGLAVLFTTFNLLPLLYFLPKAILSAIVCVVVFSILSETPHEVAFFIKMRAYIDLSLMATTFLLTFAVSVEVGLGVSFVLSILLCIRQSASIRIKILGRVPGGNTFEPLDDDDLDELEEIPGILIVRIADTALTFANAGTLKDKLKRLERYGREKSHPSELPKRENASVIIFDLKEVEVIDASACQLIHEAVDSYQIHNVLVYFAKAQNSPLESLRISGVVDVVGEQNLVKSIEAALAHIASSARLYEEI